MEHMRDALEIVLLVHIGALALSGANASFDYPQTPAFVALGGWLLYMLLDAHVLHRVHPVFKDCTRA
eukprot:6748119-Prymnesium_polylepis.1